MSGARVCAATAAGVVVLCGGTTAGPNPLGCYGTAYRVVQAPPVEPPSFLVVGDVLADGRIVAATHLTVYVETAPGAGVFEARATIDPGLVGGGTDPAFLRVSPGGSRVAIGAGFGRPVIVFDAALLDAEGGPALLDDHTAHAFAVAHYEAGWASETELAVTGGDFGSPAHVTLLDVMSNPAAPLTTLIATNIGGASAGVAFDADGRLYTGNGFDNGPGGSDTGTVKAFEESAWRAGPVDFEAGGAVVCNVLSAAGVRFDGAGNLLVGGGDFAEGDAGYLGVVSAAAVASAVAGGGPADRDNPLHVRRLDPRGDGAGYYGCAVGAQASDLHVIDGATWHATRREMIGDVTNDCAVTGLDLAMLLGAWGSADPAADLTSDGVVDGADLAALLANWTAPEDL